MFLPLRNEIGEQTARGLFPTGSVHSNYVAIVSFFLSVR